MDGIRLLRLNGFVVFQIARAGWVEKRFESENAIVSNKRKPKPAEIPVREFQKEFSI
jgi:hypothetical protein